MVPHIVAGLNYGRIQGEYEALRIIRRFQPSALVVVVLTPLKGTPMARVSPLPPIQVARLITRARVMIPDIPISLGCERPRNKGNELMEALAIYAAPGAGKTDVPIKDKDELKQQLVLATQETRDFLSDLDIDLEKIRKTKDVFQRVQLKDDAVNAVLQDDDTKKSYLRLADTVKKLYRAYLPDPVEQELAEKAS